jgi:hypothetical protein
MYSVRISVYLEHILRTQNPDTIGETFAYLEGLNDEKVKGMAATITKES